MVPRNGLANASCDFPPLQGYSLAAVVNGTQEVALAANYSAGVRFAAVSMTTAALPLDDFRSQLRWSVASPSSIGGFSAVCWFFGIRVYDGLNRTVPIGLIHTSWGGELRRSVCGWTRSLVWRREPSGAAVVFTSRTSLQRAPTLLLIPHSCRHSHRLLVVLCCQLRLQLHPARSNHQLRVS